jgi:hypothetical protein
VNRYSSDLSNILSPKSNENKEDYHEEASTLP